MKKLAILVAISMFAVIALAGCAPPAEEPETPAEPDENDVVEAVTYTAVSEANERGYVEVELDVEGDEIVDARISEYDGFGFLKDYETYGGDRFTILEEAHTELAGWIVEENTWDVDTYTGATSTSEKARSAAKHAAIKAGLEDPPAGEHFDGTFMGVSEQGERGQFGLAWVTLENDEIVDVVLEEAAPANDDDYELKDEEYGQEQGYTEFHEAQDELPQRFIEAQGAEVDIYSGATGSSELWMQAVANALEAAKIN